MNRISKMLLLLLLVTTPVALFVLDNQQVVKEKSETITPKAKVESKDNMAYSNFDLE